MKGMTATTDRYSYRFNGYGATLSNRIDIISPEGTVIASLHYDSGFDDYEPHRVEMSAQDICRHLNKWQFEKEWQAQETRALTPLP
jgi:hypothetical protein